MAATAEEKFNAAVKVIRGLPKNGSFQPSHELMLKFYAYYKQATEGPCTGPKPGIWNLVNRKKWEAWSELGEMQKESAMLLYVDELKNIVETMPQTEQVAEFVQTLGHFYELVEEGEKDSIPKTGKQPNGSAAFNGEGDDRLDHSAAIGEMLRINNNDPKKGGGDKGDSWDRDRESINGAGNGMNGLGDTSDDDEDDDNNEEEEVEEAEEKGVEDSTRVDSGSDTDEFCDTSDQMIQIPSKLASLQMRQAEMSTSTPVDGKRETRVRFAPHIHMADDDRVSLNSYGNGPDLSRALNDMSNLSTEMMNERLGLGSPTGFSFLPQTTEFPPRQMTESLHVNNSFSSLASLAGNDSVAGDEVDEGAALDDEDLTFSGNCDLVSSRGGGQEDGASSRATQGSYTSGRDSAGGAANRSRDFGRNTGGSSRRGLFPSGSGGGGQRRGGEGRQLSGSLDEQILLTLIGLQRDMTDISNRLASLELTVKLQREEQAKKAVKQSKWWLFPGMSKKVVFLLVVWPFLAPFIINLICRRRRSAPR